MSAHFPLNSLERWNSCPVVCRVCGLPEGAGAPGPPRQTKAMVCRSCRESFQIGDFLLVSSSEHLHQVVVEW